MRIVLASRTIGGTEARIVTRAGAFPSATWVHSATSARSETSELIPEHGSTTTHAKSFVRSTNPSRTTEARRRGQEARSRGGEALHREADGVQQAAEEPESKRAEPDRKRENPCAPPPPQIDDRTQQQWNDGRAGDGVDLDAVGEYVDDHGDCDHDQPCIRADASSELGAVQPDEKHRYGWNEEDEAKLLGGRPDVERVREGRPARRACSYQTRRGCEKAPRRGGRWPGLS